MPIPSLAAWRASTELGLLSRRSDELKAIDDRIAAYNRAMSAYGKGWEAREIRIALDAWKAKRPAGQKWQDDERNKKVNGDAGPFAALDAAPELPPSRAAQTQDAEVGERLRSVTLQFFGKCRTEAVPADGNELLTTYVDTASDTQAGVQTVASRGQQQGSSFLDQITKGASDLLKGLADRSGGTSYATGAANLVIQHLPQIIATVLGSVLSQLKNVADIAKNLATAVKAGVLAWQTRNLEDGIVSGHPRLIVQSVREQIKDSGKDAVKGAVKTALLTGISIANPIAGTVVNAIASLYGFITALFERIKEQFKLRAFFESARTQSAKALYKDPAGFQQWFGEEIKDLPIVSAICMANPLLGGYCGFLTLVSTDGTELSYRALERNYGQFNDVKQAARDFVKDYKVKIYGVDELTQHYLNLTKSGGIAGDVKEGFMDRLKDLGYDMAAQAVS